MKGKTDKQGERKGGKTVSAERREEILRRIRSVMTEETPDLWEKIDRRLGPRDEAAKKSIRKTAVPGGPYRRGRRLSAALRIGCGGRRFGLEPF